MHRVCAWCKKALGESRPLTDLRDTHGVCPSCAAKLGAQQDKKKTPAPSVSERGSRFSYFLTWVLSRFKTARLSPTAARAAPKR